MCDSPPGRSPGHGAWERAAFVEFCHRHDDRRRRSEQRRTDTSRRRGERTRSRHHGRPSADRDPRREARDLTCLRKSSPAVLLARTGAAMCAAGTLLQCPEPSGCLCSLRLRFFWSKAQAFFQNGSKGGRRLHTCLKAMSRCIKLVHTNDGLQVLSRRRGGEGELCSSVSQMCGW